MSWVAIKLFFGNALGVLSKIPREVWYILGAALLLWLAYSKGDSDAREAIQIEQEEQAREAEKLADENAAERDEKLKAEQADAKEALENAARENPEEAAAPAGPVTRTAIDRLRR